MFETTITTSATPAVTAATMTAPAAAPRWQRYAPHRQRQPRRVVDKDGTALVHMPLKGGALAVIEAEDFDRLMSEGITSQWRTHDDGHGLAYVRVKTAKGLLMLARLILNTPPGKVIRYADHNPFNLRRENLVFDDGFSKQREKLPKPAAPEGWPAESDASEGFIF
jgi:hypothetical protein